MIVFRYEPLAKCGNVVSHSSLCLSLLLLLWLNNKQINKTYKPKPNSEWLDLLPAFTTFIAVYTALELRLKTLLPWKCSNNILMLFCLGIWVDRAASSHRALFSKYSLVAWAVGSSGCWLAIADQKHTHRFDQSILLRQSVHLRGFMFTPY